MSDSWKGPYVTIDDAMKIVAERDEFKADVVLLGQALQTITMDFAAKIEENKKLKQLFVDLSFCYTNKEYTHILHHDTHKAFKEIVGDDPEFVDVDKLPDNN